MSGSPSEAQIRTQWSNVVDLLEDIRAFADGTVAADSGLLDTLEQSLHGQYTPTLLAPLAAGIRSTFSSMVGPSLAAQFMAPILFEYARQMGFGGGYRDVDDLAVALYEHFHENSLTVKSRAITYDTSGTPGGSNVGNGAIARLTVDERGYYLEACNVETKILRCRQDENTGADLEAEVFELLGEAQSADNLLRSSHGTGDSQRIFMTAKNAGSGAGGSLCSNSSFDNYDSAATNVFSGWEKQSGTIDQDTSHTYRGNPSTRVGDEGSLRIDGAGGTCIMRQDLADMNLRAVNVNRPHFLRVMWNREVGSASGGTLKIRLGDQEETVSISAQTGWNELMIPLGVKCWPRIFNEAGFGIELEWTSPTSGTLLLDDLIFCEMDPLDGTFAVLRANAASPTAWLLDDTIQLDDTGGAPANAKIQWWFFLATGRYLPSDGSPTFSDP